VAADGRVVDEGVIGELLLQLVLAESGTDDQAARAAEGWAGDRYEAWQNGRRTCVRATVVMDSDAEAAELLAGLRAWGADHTGATIASTAAAAVTFARCA
jgi:hypothetical protein